MDASQILGLVLGIPMFLTLPVVVWGFWFYKPPAPSPRQLNEAEWMLARQELLAKSPDEFLSNMELRERLSILADRDRL